MKLIKILGKESYFLDNIVNGESIEITKSAESIEFFTLQKSLENQTRYIVELSPDENNPLNYDGITIALKIYFKHLQEKLYEFEILLFGFDTKESIFLNNDYSFFLKCPNVHYKTLNFTNHWHLENHIIPIPKEEAKIALKKLGIKPPSSYKTQHSITNEWAIFRWSSYLGIKTSLEKEITNSLYFQYLITIHEIEPIASKQNFLPAKGKILVIDDEIDKGWEDFFKSLKFPSDKDLKLETIGKGFKSLENQEQVIDLIEEKIRIFNPDIIILDLRLLDADFEEKDTKKITGFKVLEKIKNEINRGIQVILFTASNKVWNYQSLLEVGFDGWVVKESPELSTDPFYTKNAIKDLKLQIEMCLSRSNYLSPAWLIHNKIKENLEVASKEKRIDKKISNEIKSFLKPSYKMYESASSKEDFAFSYLALFKTLEYIANEYTFKDSDSWQITGLKPLNQYLWNNTTYSYEKIMTPNFKNNTPSLFEKIASICFQLLGYMQNDVQELYYTVKRRNEFIHPSTKEFEGRLKEECGKIYTSEGYLTLLQQIHELTRKITE